MSFIITSRNTSFSKTINKVWQIFVILTLPFITTSCSDPVYNGCMYEGERLNGLPHGSGTIACPHGRTIYPNPVDYRGEWKEGKRDGKGEIWVRDTLNPEKVLGKYNVECKDDECWDTASGSRIPTAYEY